MKKMLIITVIVLLVSASIFGYIFLNTVSAAEIKEYTLNSIADVTTYTYSTSTEVTTTSIYNEKQETIKTSMIGNGAMDTTNKKFRIHLTSIPSDQTETQTTFAYYLIDNEIYMKLNYFGTEQWIKMEISEQLNTLWDSYDQMQIQADLLEASKVERLNDEKVNGIDCYVLNIIPDVKEILNILSNQQGLGTTSTYQTSYLSDMIKNVNIKLYVDKATSYIMKVYEEITTETSLLGHTTSSTFEITLIITNHNKPVDINLPNEAETAVDYSTLLQSFTLAT